MSTKVKILGEQYGVTITRPFSKEMYAHNSIVADEAKSNIRRAVNNRKWTAEELNEMTRSITAYTFGLWTSREEIREEMLKEVDVLQDWWLAQEYPTLVKEGYCKPLKTGFVGFDKSNNLKHTK